MIFIKYFYLIFIMFLYSLEYIKMYQLNGYEIKFYKGTLKSYFKLILASIICFLINIFSLKISYIIYGIICFIIILESEYFQRQKINVTNRIKRLFLMYILIMISIAFSFILFFEKYFYLTLILIPFLLHLSNLLLQIIEIRIQKKYINIAIKKLKNKKPYIIGITGSFGKTTVKNLLYEILSIKYNVLKSPKNFNTPMGICKSVELLKDEDIFIMELGARHKKDIEKMCKMIDVNLGIITSIGEQHLSTFKSIENVYKTKRELQENLVKDGVMIFNDYDSNVDKMKQEFNGEKYGIKDFKFKIISLDNLSFVFEYKSNQYTIHSKFCLLHNVYNILLAIRCGLYFGLNIEEMIPVIEKANSVDNRFNKKVLDNGVVVLDDSYNSNYIGAVNAIKFLENYKNVSKIVFSQGLVEQGYKSYKVNYNLGKEIAKVADKVILLGPNKRAILKGLKDSHFNKKYIICIRRFKDVYKFLNENLIKGDVLLIQNDLTDNY